MVKKNYKRIYYANKRNPVIKAEEDNSMINKLEKGKYYTAQEMRVKMFGEQETTPTIQDKIKTIDKRIDKLILDDINEKLDTLTDNLSKYIKHSKKWLFLRIGGGVIIGVVSLTLFVYGKIKLDTLLELLKVIGSSVGMV